MSTAQITVDELLTRAVSEVIDQKHLKDALKSGRKLRVKFGIDPTGREIHLGHSVPIRLLRRFQLLGHQVVFIVGDYTAMIGDPSGRTEARLSLSFEQTRENAKTYFDQAFKILDRKQTEIHYNSEWFHNFNLAQTIKLLSQATIGQLMAHETFRERLKRGQPFFAHEILYPLLQAYDSVAVKADVEVGGLDQKFNLLMGRELQTAQKHPAQDVVLTDYLAGLDGKEKMSKTAGNYIAITDQPAEMYGKVMSIPDDQIVPYFTLVTDLTDEAIILIKKELSSKSNPRDIKMRLSKTIVGQFYSGDQATEAEEAWKTKFQRTGSVVVDREVKISSSTYTTVDLIIHSGLAHSKSEARRKLSENAVEIFFGEENQPLDQPIKLDRPLTIRLGKRFVRLIPQ